MSDMPSLTVIGEGPCVLQARGAWTVANVELLERLCDGASRQIGPIDLSRVTALDTVGAWLFEKLARRDVGRPSENMLLGVPGSYAGLLAEVRGLNRGRVGGRRGEEFLVARLTRFVRGLAADAIAFLDMLGAVSAALLDVMRRPASFRLTSTVYQIGRVGWQAIPIMALITFLIGAIIAQQGIFHFRKFGADSYVVDMIGILVLREIGVLIVAIMVAGRSGSAFTAELGSMQMREEVDALRTMGFDPIEVLILPRIVALLIGVPILTFLGSMAALYGGGLVAWLYGGIDPDIYLSRLKEAISLQTFEVGMIKAPFMAMVIGVVACVDGLAVKGSSESLGLQTTASVVESIFLVIVLDGFFAIFFASIGM